MTNTDGNTVEKLMIVRDSKGQIEGWVLPKDLTMSDIKSWTARFLMQVAERNALQQKRLERFEGRTFNEDWAKPTRYANITSNSPGGDFDVGLRVMELIELEGRQTIDEVCREIGAVDREPLTIIVNNMRAEHWIKDYTEHSGEHTFELTTRAEHNILAQLPPPKPPKVVIMSCLPYLNSKEDTRYDVPKSVSL